MSEAPPGDPCVFCGHREHDHSFEGGCVVIGCDCRATPVPRLPEPAEQSDCGMGHEPVRFCAQCRLELVGHELLKEKMRVAARAVAALERHSRHDSDCPTIFDESICGCGLSSVLSEWRRCAAGLE